MELIVNALRFVPALIEDLTENHEQQRRTTIALAAAKDRLEERVAERTQELDARNSKLRVVLDHVGQALFTVDLDGRISHERSAAFDQWFPHACGGMHLWTMPRTDQLRCGRVGIDRLGAAARGVVAARPGDRSAAAQACCTRAATTRSRLPPHQSRRRARTAPGGDLRT